MIAQLRGRLVRLTPPSLTIDVNGVGYELEAPMSTVYNLPSIGSELVLLTHQVFRDDAQLLFGFSTADERMAFRELIRVSGIGPKIALAVLSGISVDQLRVELSQQNSAAFKRIPGIGQKTAERLVLELRGRFNSSEAVLTSSSTGIQNDVVSGLIALGYSDKEARLAIRELDGSVSVSEGMRLALKQLSR